MVEGAIILSATARTAVGRSLAASVAAVRAGLARLIADPVLRDERGKPVVTARAGWLPEEITDRVVRLARPAAFEAMAVLHNTPRRRVHAYVGVASSQREGRPDSLDAALRRCIGEAVARTGKLDHLELIPADHAAGLFALHRALEHLSSHREDVCLVGGVDSWLDEDSIAALDASGRVRTGRHRFGFTPGEAAAFLVVAAPDNPDAPALASIAATATSIEKAEVNTGEALTRCFRTVLSSLACAERAERAVGDLNGEPWRADELGMSLVRCGAKVARGNTIISPVASWGDVGAASGPLGVGLVVAAMKRGWGATPALVWASSVNGERGAALVRP